MQLIYRAHRFEYVPATRPVHFFRACNWRYQTSGSAQVPTAFDAPTLDRQPRAMNWRYQVVLEA